MRTYNEAHEYSKQNPTELVEFCSVCDDRTEWTSGFLLNGKREGLNEYHRDGILQHRGIYNSETSQTKHIYFMPDGSVQRQYFSRRCVVHGEYIWYNEDGSVEHRYFYNSGSAVKELDYLFDEERDDAFYVTLAMHSIDKEYTFVTVVE